MRRSTRDIALFASLGRGLIGRARRSVAAAALVGTADPASHTVLLDTLESAGVISSDPAPAPAPTPTVRISAAVTHLEGDTLTKQFLYTVTRTNLEGALAVNWTFNAGTTSAADFAGGVFPAGGVVNFADGVATGQFTVTTVGDTLFEPNESFTVGLVAPAGYALGSPNTATGTITNDDTAPLPTISFTTPQSVTEGNTGAVAIIFPVIRSSSVGAVEIQVTFDPGTTVAADWQGGVFPSNLTVQMANGVSNGQVLIYAVGDVAVESDETFGLQLVAPAGYALGSPSSSTGTILNDDTGTAGIPDTPVLSDLSSGWASGDKPPRWDTEFSPLEYNGDEGDAGFGQGDQVRVRWKLGNGTFTAEAWIPYWIDPTPGAPSVVLDGFLPFYDFLTDESLDAGGELTIYVDVIRDLGLPTQSIIVSSNPWIDILPAAPVQANIVHRGTGNLPWAFGDQAITVPAIACELGDKLVISVAIENNTATGWTVTAVDQSAQPIALNFIGVSTGQYRVLQYYADTAGVTSISVTVDPTGGGCAGGALSVDAVIGAEPGPPVAQYFETRTLAAEDPHDLDGGVAVPELGRVLLALNTYASAITFNNALQIGQRSSTTGNLYGILVAEQETAGNLTTPGAPSGGIGYGPIGIGVTAWAPLAQNDFTKLGVDGDSITAGGGTYAGLWAADNPGVPYFNQAQGGAALGLPAHAGNGNNSLWGRVNLLIAQAPSHVFFQIGANDFASAGAATDAGTYYAEVMQYVNYLRANIPGVKVIVGGNILGTNAFRNTTSMALWTLYRAGVLSGDFDGYIPVGEHPTATAAWHANPVNSDGLHPSASGHALYKTVFAAGMDPIVANSTAVTPSAFSFADVANAALNSAQSALAFITGMALGTIATASVTGGTIARGQGAAGAGTFPTMNGDVVTAAHNASGANATPTNTAVTVGSTSDTFTSTTVSNAPAITLAEGTLLAVDHGDFLGTRTYELEFPAGRPIVGVFPVGGGTMATVSFEGQGGTRMATHNTDGARDVWIGPQVLAETTTLTVEVTRGAGMNNNTLLPMSAVDMGAGGTFASSAVLATGYRADGPHAANGSVTVGAGGRGLVLYYNDLGGPGVAFDIPAGWTLEKAWGNGWYTLSFTSTQTPTITALIFGCITSMLAVGLAQ